MHENDSDCAEVFEPLKVSVMVDHRCSNVVTDAQQSRWTVHQRLVTPHPAIPFSGDGICGSSNTYSSSIETVWEVETNNHWNQRIAIYSGPDLSVKSLHISLQLPLNALAPQQSNTAERSSLAWVKFPEQRFPVLCCLVNPHLLCLWDIYPGSESPDTPPQLSLPSEGWTITLPFDCRTIAALESALLLQRMDDVEDTNAAFQLGEDDGFVLQGPPAWKHRMQSLQSPALFSSPKPRLSPPDQTTAVTSLFTLHHPLEDVLPVTVITRETLSQQSPVTDVFEQVVWAGTAEWFNETKDASSKHSAQLMVTYHTVHKRHAIWKLAEAPAPPKAPPLYQQTRQKYTIAGNADLTTFREMEDFDFLDLQADDLKLPSTSQRRADPPFSKSRVTRDEALADALGVRRSPRKSIGTGVSASSRRRSTNEPAPSLFSPNAGGMMDISHSTSVVGTTAGTGNSPGYATGPANCLHAKIAVTCLYMEDARVAEARADTIFLASNCQATGTLVLALVCASKELKLYTVLPKTSKDGATSLTVLPLATIPCISARPILACPTPPCCLAPKQQLSVWTTDILVLRENGKLTLFRADVPSIDCALEGSYRDKAIITGLVDPVKDAFTLELCNETTRENWTIRCKMNLSLGSSSAAAAKVLSALDAAFYSRSFIDVEASNEKMARRFQIALKIRADCTRLVQSLQSRSLQDGFSVQEDTVFAALRAVLLTIAQYELSGESPRVSNTMQQTPGSVWQCLLDSDYHQMYSMDNQTFLIAERDGLANTIQSTEAATSVIEDTLSSIGSLSISILRQIGDEREDIFHQVFDSVHLLYEDSKLSMCSAGKDMAQLASLLVELCQTVQALDRRQVSAVQTFLDYYRHDMGETLFEITMRSVTTKEFHASNKVHLPGFKLTSFLSPPSMLSWIEGAMKRGIVCGTKGGIYELGDSSVINAACSKTRSILRIFSLLRSISDSPSRDVKVLLSLLEEGFTDAASVQEDLPAGVSLPLLEVLFRCRNQSGLAELPGWSSAAWTVVGRQDLGMNMSVNQTEFASDFVARRSSPFQSGHIQGDSACKDELKDGLVPVERSAAMFFPDDNRVHEAARLLCSSRPIFLRVARAVEVSDHDYERVKQKRLLLLSYRALALPTGRGMLTIGGLYPVPAEPLPLPDLCLKGRVPPTNATLNLDTSECPADMQVWPEFHNGVAAGLRLPVDSERAQFGFTITRTWILYNRQPVSRPPPSQDTGDDTNPAPLAQSYSHGGILLALGLRGHLTCLDMSDIYDYLTQGSATTTVGVLLGLAANKRASCDLSVSKILCLHIPSLIPQHFSAIDVASTVQTAAVTGAGLLFQGSSHRMMTEFLLNEIGKRPDTDVNTSDREAYTLACGLALGTVNLCLGETTGGADRTSGLADLHIEERLIRYIIGGVDNDEADRTRESNDRFSLPNSLNGNDSERCSTIFESNLINTSVTAPGATLALGLLYMKTGNKTIASALILPDTHFLLEFVRPDFLGLRVISRALILWDEVAPSKEWIDEQIPLVVRAAYQQMGVAAKTVFGMRSPGGKPRQDLDYDRRAVRQIYVHVVSAACFGIGLRFAGTGNADAKAALLERVLELHALREASDPVSAACRPEIPILETCLGCAAISLAMVLAGTGDLEALKVFKILRWRCDNDSQYGIQMIYGMAVGLLFLGGGKCTLGREPADIAALVTAFFPRFPTTTSDNQYHLQALRHLYALAVKRKELRAIDVDTSENVDVTVQISTGETTDPQLFKVPCLLRNSESPLKQLQVLSDKYYPLKVDLSHISGSCVFYVKKRNVQLTNAHNRVWLRRSLGVARQNATHIVQSSSDNPFLTAFADYICPSSCISQRKYLSTDQDFVSRALLECLTEDAEEALSVYLALRQGIQALKLSGSSTAISFLWNLRLIRTYYQERKHLVGECNYSKPLLDTQLLLPYLQELTDRVLLLEHQDASPYAFSLYG